MFFHSISESAWETLISISIRCRRKTMTHIAFPTLVSLRRRDCCLLSHVHSIDRRKQSWYSLGVNSIMSLAIISLSLNLPIDLFIACWLLIECGKGGDRCSQLALSISTNEIFVGCHARTMNDVWRSKCVCECVCVC